MTFFIVVAILLLVFATPIALTWWNLVRKAAPYRDELGETGGQSGKTSSDHEVVVIPQANEPKRGA